jgi:tetratricopeptide (TPR) repeat protein
LAALQRCKAAAKRSVELDPTSQDGWRALAEAHFFERDLNGLRIAAERAVTLNPMFTNIVAYVGLMLAFAGDWTRGVEIVEHAMDLNPNHPVIVNYVLAANHWRLGEFEQALVQAKRSTLTQYPFAPLYVAAAAGQLGRVADAKLALDAIGKNHPQFLDAGNARTIWSIFLWDAGMIEQLVEGFEKAKALVDPPADAMWQNPPKPM